MNINCVICSDLFTPNGEIYTTPCGHIFHYTCLLNWLEQSRSCPQCRNKVTKGVIHRLYFNLASSDDIQEDVSVLQHKLDGLQFQLKLKDKDIQNFTEKYKTVKAQTKALRVEIQKLELTEKTHESAMAALKDQIKFFKHKSQDSDRLREELAQLKKQIRDMEHVQTAITGSRHQVDDIIRNENNIESLALLAAMLKKSLVESDRKKKELQYQLKQTQNECSLHKRNMAEKKCEYEDTKRQLESLRQNYEKEVSFLKNKFSQLENKLSNGDLCEAVNNSIRRITQESPVNFNRTPVLSSRSFIDLSESLPNTPQSVPDTYKKLINDIANTEDSPMPPSSLGVLGIQSRIMSITGDPHSKYSIFKNKQHPKLEPVKLNTSSEVCYDGFGSSSKEDIFPSPKDKILPVGLKRPKTSKFSSAKFKKLSADAGKTRKVSDFFN